MQTPTVILFDIDGTLLTCGGAGRRAMEAAGRERWERDDVFGFTFGGRTDRAIAREAHARAEREATEETLDAFLSTYLRHLEVTLPTSADFRVFAGAADLVDHLLADGRAAVGLGTGNLERGARIKLRHAGLDDRFPFGGFGSDDEDRPRLLDAGARKGAARLGVARSAVQVVVVGDTPRDILAARAIGARVIAVATGHYGAEELAEHQPDALVPALTDPSLPGHLGLSA